MTSYSSKKMAWDTCIYVVLAVIVAASFAPASAAFIGDEGSYFRGAEGSIETWGHIVEPRNQTRIESNARTWLDKKVVLPCGRLMGFQIYTSEYKVESTEDDVRIHLQIWHQDNGSNYELVFDQVETVPNINGKVEYTVGGDTYIPAGSHMGITVEADFTPVNFDYVQGYTLQFRLVPGSNYPEEGQVLPFQALPNAAVFSLAVAIDTKALCLPGPTGPTDSPAEEGPQGIQGVPGPTADTVEEGGTLTAGVGNIYGNDVRSRSAYLPSGARKSWVDLETVLPAGTLKKYFLYAHEIRSAELETNVVLQIWRPSNPPLFSFALIWEQVVTLGLNHPNGALHTFEINEIVSVETADRIGWQNVDSFCPISFEYKEGRHTYFRQVEGDLPVVGGNYTFDNIHSPSTFSVAVEIDTGQTGPRGTTIELETGTTDQAGLGCLGSSGSDASNCTPTEAPGLPGQTDPRGTTIELENGTTDHGGLGCLGSSGSDANNCTPTEAPGLPGFIDPTWSSGSTCGQSVVAVLGASLAWCLFL